MRNVGIKRRNVVMFTLLLWLLISAIWAYVYGRSGLAAAMKAPEDSIFRLPLLRISLAAALLAEFRFLKGENE